MGKSLLWGKIRLNVNGECGAPRVLRNGVGVNMEAREVFWRNKDKLA